MATQIRGRADYLDLGNWNAQCGLCGRKRKAGEMKQLPPGVPGAGLYVCNEHEYKRNPQDYVKGIPDDVTPPWTQPQVDTMIQPTYNIDSNGDYLIPTSSSYVTILTIFDGITVPALTISGSGTLIVNNWGIVEVVVNPSATIVLRNYGLWP